MSAAPFCVMQTTTTSNFSPAANILKIIKKKVARLEQMHYHEVVGGCSSMVEQKPSKLMTRVRFPSPAPLL